MNIQKFTQKSMQAVEGCEKLAYEYGNQEIEQEHLLYSLLKLDDSLILKLIEKMEIQKEHFVNRVEQALNKRPKVQGGKVYVGEMLNKVLVKFDWVFFLYVLNFCMVGTDVILYFRNRRLDRLRAQGAEV